MYLTLFIMFVFVFWTGAILAQQGSRPVDDKQTTSMEKRMQMRAEMHRRMMEKLINGVGPDQDMFQDMEKFMEEIMADSFTGFESLTPQAENYKMEWSESATGRTLNLTPKTPEQQLDINVSNGLIIIKGKVEDKRPNGIVVSNFTNSFNVPGDCDPAKVKISQHQGKILVSFPWRTAKPADIKPKQDLKPIPPSETDVTI